MKETILAIILGSLLGFGLTGTYFAIKKNRPNNNLHLSPPPTETISTTSPTPSETQSNTDYSPSTPTTDNLIIDSPENESIANNSQISIKGTSTPLSTIIITTATNSYTTQTDNSGNFTQTIDIESGVNQIQVDSVDQNDNQSTKKIIVTYSTAKI